MRRILPMLAAALMLAATTGAARAQSDSFVSFQSLTPELALELTQATVRACQARGYQVAVAVVDRWGIPQALMRDRFAGPHTPETAIRKATTAVSFRTPTTSLAENTKAGTAQSGARDIPGMLMLGGGELVEAGGQVVAGIGVSGAPSGEEDAACARAGIDTIADKLLF